MTEFSTCFPGTWQCLFSIFDEDWPTEYDSPEQALEHGVRWFWKQEDVLRMLQEIPAVLSKYEGEEELEDALLDAGISYEPSVYGESPHAWLRRVGELAKAFLARDES